MKKTYQFSEEYINRKKSLFNLMRIMFPIFLLLMFAPMIYSVNQTARWSLVAGGVMAIVILQIMLTLIPRSMFAQMKNISVDIENNVISKNFPSRQQKFVIDQDTKLKILKKK